MQPVNCESQFHEHGSCTLEDTAQKTEVGHLVFLKTSMLKESIISQFLKISSLEQLAFIQIL